MRLVLVEWVDSHQVSAGGVWTELGASTLEDKALTMHSVGWLAIDGEHAKVIVPHHSGEHSPTMQGAGIMSIPARSVIRLVNLEEVRDFATSPSSCQAPA